MMEHKNQVMKFIETVDQTVNPVKPINEQVNERDNYGAQESIAHY